MLGLRWRSTERLNLPANRAATEFRGNGRFVLEGRLGDGGMGVVYRARDRESSLSVALKTMTHIEPSALLRFKNEFRSLADISHPNVVQLYEMVADGGHWFFTMELVDGVDFMRWVRPARACDLPRLRAALQQLAQGVLAIHSAGKLHGGGSRSRSDEPIMGTPAYMSPEQARGQPASVASDWYSVGVMLYEALTDHLPFEGSPHEILFGKQDTCVLRPSALAGDVPAELESLCLDLLQLDPKRRPPADEVVARLNQGESGWQRAVRPAVLGGHSVRPFVGRKRQLEQLADALAASTRGTPVVLLMAGRSGIGKTVLAQQFSNAAFKEPNTIVLAGRCFEREALPFKGTDSIVDELSRYLTRHAPAEITEALPPGLHYLARV